MMPVLMMPVFAVPRRLDLSTTVVNPLTPAGSLAMQPWPAAVSACVSRAPACGKPLGAIGYSLNGNSARQDGWALPMVSRQSGPHGDATEAVHAVTATAASNLVTQASAVLRAMR